MEEVSIKKNFIYKSILTISNYLINFITFPYVSRVLGVEYIGLVNFADNTVNYFLLFATLGINILGVREIASVKDNLPERNKIFSNLVGMNIVFTIFTLLVYWICIKAIPQLNQYEELFYIGSAKILFTTFLMEWFFTGIENFRYITLRTLLIKILYVILVFIFIRSPEDYKIYFIMTVGIVVINALINTTYIQKFVTVNIRELFAKTFYQKNIMLGIYSIMGSMYLTFNVMYLGFVSNNVEVGYYTTAFKLYSVILGLFSAFTNVMLPRMSALLSSGNKDSFQRMANKSFQLMSTFSIPMIICSIILAPQLVYVLSGEGYEGAVLPMQIIMPAVLFVGIAQILAIQILTPMKKDKVLLIASITGASIALTLNLSIVSSMHSLGTAIVLLCSEFAVTTVYIIYIVRHKMIEVPFRSIWYNLLLSLPYAGACLICKYFIKNPFLLLIIAAFINGFIFTVIYRFTAKSLYQK